MKYKVGDKVRVRKDLIEGQFHGGAVFYREMSPLLGSIVTISHVFTGVNRYHLLEHHTGEYWTDEMLEDVEEDKLEDVKFEAGKWYKGEANNYYFKAAESLLAEANKRYPVGTRFISVNDKLLYTVKTDSHRWCYDGIYVEGISWVYLNGRWAEIVESPTNQQKITPNGLAHIECWCPVNPYGSIYTTVLDPINDESSKNKGESKSTTNESAFPIISTKRIINFSQLT